MFKFTLVVMVSLSLLSGFAFVKKTKNSVVRIFSHKSVDYEQAKKPIKKAVVKKARKVKVRKKVRRTKRSKSYTYRVRGKTYRTIANAKGYNKNGTASWYGKPFHGRKTANGETYNMYAMTAAHKRLPLGTKVKVTNLSNKRSVILHVNDHGPFHGNRLIDVSYAAAKKLDFIRSGVARVKIQVIR